MSKAEFKFDCGDKVKDKITGYQGTIIGRTDWMHQCKTYMVKSPELKDGKPIDSVPFDEDSLDLVKAPEKPRAEKTNGGDPPAVRRDITSR